VADSLTYTYFIQAANGGLVKIGKAKNPKQRLRELQTGNGEPLQLLGVTSDFTEAQLHALFQEHRRQGEWFDLNLDMTEMCAASGIAVTREGSAIPDMRWLTLRGGLTWHVVIGVPRKLRAVLGKSHLIKSLHTTDLVIARQRRHAAVAELRATIDRARGQGAAEAPV
jgi:hypothetical protein